MAKKKPRRAEALTLTGDYEGLLVDVVTLLETARRTSVRAVNAVMTVTYWEVGRRIVEVEQGGQERAVYGVELIERLSKDLSGRFGRGFSQRNLEQMRQFYLCWPIPQTLSAESEFGMLGSIALQQTPRVESATRKTQTPSAESAEAIPQITSGKSPTASLPLTTVANCFQLPWSHYVRLLSVEDKTARQFYESEALRGGWSVRQLDRQINSQFYERTLLSKNKAAMLRKGAGPQADDLVTPEEEIKDPLVLEFLDLKDEYSEHDLEEALIHKLADFLLELGGDFAFMGRQKRLRIGDEWYRIDLLFFHRRLKCLVVIDLKVGKFTHADAGQMHLYLNYAREHWTNEGENPPVGLILCAQKDEAVAHYSLEGLPNKVMASKYRLALPDEAVLTKELEKTQRALEQRGVTVALRQRPLPPKRTARSQKRSTKRKP
jgi:predicted nuclease of restriction endonuclease-like (RecB) superfamily